MCHQVVCGLKYRDCGCFDAVKKEFVDCLMETCTSSLCHPYDCIGALCICRRVWDACELKILEYIPSQCSLCYDPVRVQSPQLIRHRSLLRSTLHGVNPKYSTITREQSNASPISKGSRPKSRGTIASLADFGYDVRPDTRTSWSSGQSSGRRHLAGGRLL